MNNYNVDMHDFAGTEIAHSQPCHGLTKMASNSSSISQVNLSNVFTVKSAILDIYRNRINMK